MPPKPVNTATASAKGDALPDPDFPDQPVSKVQWVPLEKVVANDYNPNAVAKNEMRLLYISILHDGFTQPVVTIYDEALDRYVIVDGFHRYSIMRSYPDIRERTHGL